MTVFGFHIN